MSENNSMPNSENIYSANDALDINELASLNDDISPELIEQLQNKLSANAKMFSNKPSDGDLFEEVSSTATSETLATPVSRINIDDNIDDNFIKKYKAKLNKQQVSTENIKVEETSLQPPKQELQNESIQPVQQTQNNIAENKSATVQSNKDIEKLTGGNIIERQAAPEQISYNDSLDFLDENVKYSKYVIYIDPENSNFIESLTVKERKNLINRILREQDDIAITKKRFTTFQTILRHAIVAIITIALAIPVIYITINASLEATINNHRRSQKIFKTLYREKGKIKANNSIH